MDLPSQIPMGVSGIPNWDEPKCWDQLGSTNLRFRKVLVVSHGSRISERLSTLVIDVSSSKDPEEVVAAAVFELLSLGERLPLVNDRRPQRATEVQGVRVQVVNRTPTTVEIYVPHTCCL